MDVIQIAVWGATVAALSGLAVAFYKSERAAVRLGALGAFAVFYFAVLLWAPLDPLWFNLTTASVLLIAFGSNMIKKRAADEASSVPRTESTADERKEQPGA